VTTTITGRVGAVPVADNTRRVAQTGGSAAVSGGVGGDCWGGAWGGAWGSAWRSFNVGTATVSASPAADNTPRIGSAPTANNTPRVSLA
jgi:hypothetical protein